MKDNLKVYERLIKRNKRLTLQMNERVCQTCVNIFRNKPMKENPSVPRDTNESVQ